MDNYEVLKTSPVMWISAGASVLTVLSLSIIFYRRTVKDANRLGVKDEEIKIATRAAIATSVGPVLVMLASMLALMVNVGAPISWARVNYIGSVSFELQCAHFAAEGMGIDLNQAAQVPEYLATYVIVSCVASLGWVIFSLLFSDKMDILNIKIAGGNEKLIPILGGGALIGVFASMNMDMLIPFGYSAFAVIAGGLSKFLIDEYNERADKQWIREWSMTISMVIGMVVATILDTLGVLG